LWVLGGVGRVLVAAGIVVLLFVGYELWGTGLHESQGQHKLKRQYDAMLRQLPRAPTGDQPTLASSVDLPPGKPAPTTRAPQDGSVVGRIQIPAISLDTYIIEGITKADLENGPGHYPSTPLPGQKGNVGIAGHRTTYGHPFGNVDQLHPGDEIDITTVQGHFRYRIFDTIIVDPSDTHVLDYMGDNRLTLTSCNPKYSAAQRIVVQAKLAGPPAPMLVGQTTGAIMHASLGGGVIPYRPIIGWGLLVALLFFGTWASSRWLRQRGWDWRRWFPYLAGIPLCLLVLFVFFEHVGTLLPNSY
jgi:sortase A